jgi:hypothetical protein
MRLRARYSIVKIERTKRNWTIIAISDDGGNAGHMSVTNDAEAVVADMHRQRPLRPNDRIVYCDTDGRWDELRHSHGRFTEIAPGGATLAQAIERIERQGS